MTNRAKEAKRGPVCLEVGSASAAASSFPEQQSPASSGVGPAVSGEGIAASREGTERQAGDSVSSVDTPSYFPPSSNSGGGEGYVQRERENPRVISPWERYLSGDEATAGRTRG